MKRKVWITSMSILLCLLLLGLIGNVYTVNQRKAQEQSMDGLQKEKEALVKQNAALEEEGKKLEEEMAEEKAKLESMEESPSEEQAEDEEEVLEKTDQAADDTPPDDVSVITGIADAINERIAESAVAGENWGVYVKRLSDGAKESQGQGKMTAASLIKLYIMGAVFQEYDTLTEAEGKENIDKQLFSMITVSDNDAANRLTKMLGNGDAKAGRDAVNAYCSQMGYQDTYMGRMLLETNTDQENYTSPKDCGRFLEQVYSQSVEHASEMMNLLRQQERTGKIPAGVPSGIETANKTGELDTVENDAAIVFAGDTPYILCVMSENLNSTAEARETIKNLSSDVYGIISGQ